MNAKAPFDVVETTIADIHAAYLSGAPHRPATGRNLSRPHRGLRPVGPEDQFHHLDQPERARRSRRPRRRVPQGRADGPLHGMPLIMKDQGDVEGHAHHHGLGPVQGSQSRRRQLCRRTTARRGRDLHRQDHPWRTGRGRHPRFALRLDAQRLRSRTHGGRLVGRLRRGGVGEPVRRRHRPGGLRLDPPSLHLERRRRHAARPQASSAAPASTAAGPRSSARWVRCRAPSPTLRRCSTAWSPTIPPIRSPPSAWARRRKATAPASRPTR